MELYIYNSNFIIIMIITHIYICTQEKREKLFHSAITKEQLQTIKICVALADLWNNNNNNNNIY